MTIRYFNGCNIYDKLLDMKNNLKLVREVKRMTLRALADKSGVSNPQISLIENEKCDPGVSTAYKLANALGVDIRKLFPNPDK